MIEAMACGTPVIAFRRGSVAEVLEQGVSGFIIDSAEEQGALDAIGRLHSLDRREVRAPFERRFTARRMAGVYLRIYASLRSSFSARSHWPGNSRPATTRPSLRSRRVT
jgi:glycosyltransferase involved in cell wall biosynthesis